MAGKAQNNDYVADVQEASTSGWIAENEQRIWSYASADSPSFNATINAVDDVLSPGMRVRLMQSGVTKFFIITYVAMSSGSTIVTLYGGTDYTLTSATISDVAFSMMKAPLWFPMSPSKWTVEVSDANDRTSTTFGSVVQVNAAHVINLPIGAWYVSYQAYVGWSGVTSNMNVSLALSTSTSSISSKAYQRSFQTVAAGATTPVALSIEMNPMLIEVSTKTPYYLVGVFVATGTNWQLQGATYAPTYIRAVCAYL